MFYKLFNCVQKDLLMEILGKTHLETAHFKHIHSYIFEKYLYINTEVTLRCPQMKNTKNFVTAKLNKVQLYGYVCT